MSETSIMNALYLKVKKDEQFYRNGRDENVKVKKFLESCEEVFKNFSEIVVQNARGIINFYIKEQNVSVDNLIEFISFDINDPFSKQTLKRESEEAFDKIYKTCTSPVYDLFELNEPIDPHRFTHSNAYVPSPVGSVRMALQSLKKYSPPFHNTVFIDIGSGLGRNLFIASEEPFKKIIGVEISKSLHEQAKDNIVKYKQNSNSAANFELICTDALSYQFPNEDLVVYFWYPFDQVVSDPFVSSLTRQAKRNNKKVNLVFLNQVFPAIESSDYFRLRDVFYTNDYTGVGNTYFKVSIFTN